MANKLKSVLMWLTDAQLCVAGSLFLVSSFFFPLYYIIFIALLLTFKVIQLNFSVVTYITVALNKYSPLNHDGFNHGYEYKAIIKKWKEN